MNEKEFLENYNPNEYERPSVTTDVLIFSTDEDYNKLKLLLIKRKDHPFKDKWAIPGGFVNMDENLIDGARRELFEETNVQNAYLEQIYTFGDVGRDPRTRVISIAYMALVKYSNNLNIKAGDDAAEASWFEIERDKNNIVLKEIDGKNRISLNELAFDHERIVEMALDRLKNKVDYTDIAFELLPKNFTLHQVQKVFELMLGRKVLKQNFRRDIVQRLEADGKMIQLKMGRPAASYHLIKKTRKY